MPIDVAEIRQHPIYGYKFAVTRGTIADHASWWSHHDEQEVRDRWWRPEAGETVLDIGAAFGSYTLPALAAGARVVAFSPADFDTELLQKNLSLNPTLAARCLISRDGLHQDDGYFCPDHSEIAIGEAPPPRRCSRGEGCSWLRVRALDGWLDEHPGVGRVDLCKLDVEGAELGVLRGAEKMLRQWHPRLLIELHEQHVPDMAAQVWGFLEGLGVGYAFQGPVRHCVVSHAFYFVP